MAGSDYREQFLLDCLDDVAARIKARRKGRRFDIGSARRVLVDLITHDKGLVSYRLTPSELDLIRSFFDRRADFERVSDEPEYQPRAAHRSPGVPARSEPSHQ